MVDVKKGDLVNIWTATTVPAQYEIVYIQKEPNDPYIRVYLTSPGTKGPYYAMLFDQQGKMSIQGSNLQFSHEFQPIKTGRFLTGFKDVDILILSDLSYDELTKSCQTDKYARNLCNDDNLWKKLVERDFPRLLKSYRGIIESYRSLYEKYFQKQWKDLINKYTNINYDSIDTKSIIGNLLEIQDYGILEQAIILGLFDLNGIDEIFHPRAQAGQWSPRERIYKLNIDWDKVINSETKKFLRERLGYDSENYVLTQYHLPLSNKLGEEHRKKVRDYWSNYRPLTSFSYQTSSNQKSSTPQHITQLPRF